MSYDCSLYLRELRVSTLDGGPCHCIRCEGERGVSDRFDAAIVAQPVATTATMTEGMPLLARSRSLVCLRGSFGGSAGVLLMVRDIEHRI